MEFPAQQTALPRNKAYRQLSISEIEVVNKVSLVYSSWKQMTLDTLQTLTIIFFFFGGGAYFAMAHHSCRTV
jgi:hypothetical protein